MRKGSRQPAFVDYGLNVHGVTELGNQQNGTVASDQPGTVEALWPSGR